MAMRIVAGRWRGRQIEVPVDPGVRPTADKIREAWLSIVSADIPGARVLDLFAGSGALGMEALSRGAARATFVESDRDACRTINANLDKLKLHGAVLCQDAARALSNERRTYDLILCDPPYDTDATDLPFARLLADDGVLVYESSGRADAPEIDGLELRTSRKYGAARLTLFEK
jgi:16S rRNA (guanine966-N2)-methyltransferase